MWHYMCSTLAGSVYTRKNLARVALFARDKRFSLFPPLMIIISDACTMNSIYVHDPSRIINYDCTLILQIVVSLVDDSRGITYDRNMFIVQVTGLSNVSSTLV
jgi:hypothetical protein